MNRTIGRRRDETDHGSPPRSHWMRRARSGVREARRDPDSTEPATTTLGRPTLATRRPHRQPEPYVGRRASSARCLDAPEMVRPVAGSAAIPLMIRRYVAVERGTPRWRDGSAPGRGRTARAPRAGSARGRHRPVRTVVVHRAGGQRQDDDARRAGGLADRDRDAGRVDPGDHLQQAGCGRDDRAARCGRRRRSASEPGVVRVRTFHALGREILARRGCRGRSARRPRGHPGRGGAVGRRGRAPAARHRRSRGSRWSSASRRRTSPPTPTPARLARAFVAYEAAVAATRRPRLRRPHPAGDRGPRGRPDPAGALARAVSRAPGRRGAGRRPGPAPTRPPARRSGQPHLPGR